ncbi:lipoyl synthase [Pelosinus propionicus]|uniref:Multifunctional fusion protein n=1 Tax=Pelosinus propionicus DSM 13327 TaxID=1123291 RepID=A0A1I4I353_9FIRM|nr:lipoyl synthase [Pelosinus propionicus]SFL48231.1 lipoic acid synthetase [Pelosinus propionicus DSM 13327]
MIVLNWGLTPYQHSWGFQHSFVKGRRQGQINEDALILLEHSPVITLGRKGERANILASDAVLKAKDCEVCQVDRGGDVTFHGPGQLVGYPLLDLRHYGQDVHAYVEKLEEVIILTLRDYGINAVRDEEYTGVWVGKEKICAIGIGMKSWLSYHGFALNIDTDLSYFQLITPCGITERGVTSMAKILGKAPQMQAVRETIITHFMAVFGIDHWEIAEGRWLGEKIKPSWLKGHVSGNSNVKEMYGMLDEFSLTTVCSGAHCPNIGECYASRTATFMVLGSQCTRRCRFCAVPKGVVQPVDQDEPQRVAQMVRKLGLNYVVITSVTRDDLVDGGAVHFSQTIQKIRELSPETLIEVLIPDLQGEESALDVIIAAQPEVINHNVETVSALYSHVRPQADYQRSLDVLQYVKKNAPQIVTKSGIMVGLGESPAQVSATLADLRSVGCDSLTVGQYLAPSPEHIPVAEYIVQEQFQYYQQIAKQLGFSHAACGPLVRSSYHAAEGFSSKIRLSS